MLVFCLRKSRRQAREDARKEIKNLELAEDAKKRAEKLRATIEHHIFSWMDTRIPVTISLGISSRRGTDVVQINELIAESDKLMYVAKGNGKNQVAV